MSSKKLFSKILAKSLLVPTAVSCVGCSFVFAMEEIKEEPKYDAELQQISKLILYYFIDKKLLEWRGDDYYDFHVKVDEEFAEMVREELLNFCDLGGGSLIGYLERRNIGYSKHALEVSKYLVNEFEKNKSNLIQLLQKWADEYQSHNFEGSDLYERTLSNYGFKTFAKASETTFYLTKKHFVNKDEDVVTFVKKSLINYILDEIPKFENIKTIKENGGKHSNGKFALFLLSGNNADEIIKKYLK